MPRKICFVTGSRAEYGHLRWVARAVAADPRLVLQWIVVGAHLTARHGATYREIERDSFVIDEKVPLPAEDGSDVGAARSIGAAVAGIGEALGRLRPDILVVLGDRYEMLAAASAATVLRIPIAHIHGGEVTEGAFDDAIRHAITKMAHIHFAAAEPYRQRILQLGESPERVVLSGAPGMDFVDGVELQTNQALEAHLGHSLGEGFLLVTYHPVTLEDSDDEAVMELLAALDAFPERKVVITGVNADPGRDRIAVLLHAYAARGPERVCLIESLGQSLYLAAIKAAGAVVGNSSSGLLEAPVVGTPTVNVGDRQKGRLRARSVIDCAAKREEVRSAIALALDPTFRRSRCDGISPYRVGNASRTIATTLADAPLSGLLKKGFNDLAPSGYRHAC